MKDNLFNDSFDNLSFSSSGRCIVKSQARASEENHFSSDDSDFLRESDVEAKAHVEINQASLNIEEGDSDFPYESFSSNGRSRYIVKSQTKPISEKNSILIDNSDFLSESFSIYLNELNLNNTKNDECKVENEAESNEYVQTNFLSQNIKKSDASDIKCDFSNESFLSSGRSHCLFKSQTRANEENCISVDDSDFLRESFSIYLNELNNTKNDECNIVENDVETILKSEKCPPHDSNNEFKVENEVATILESQYSINHRSQDVRDDDDGFNLKCRLEFWGLPEGILQKYHQRNVTKMFQWQVDCLSIPNLLLHNKNLVYSAPTSAGKTLVAEILAIKTVLERQKKVIFILPFVSVVREKMFYFQDIFGASGVRVDGFMGSYNPPGGFKGINVAICTIEKANSLINRLMEEGKLSNIGAVIVDEMHLLGDYHRGYLLELLLTKLRYMSMKNNEVNVQIIGMSATLPNLHLLAKWLGAELFTTSFRPIPLSEQCHLSGKIYNNKLEVVRTLNKIPELDQVQDSDNILQLCLETIMQQRSVLIFCPTKNWCENLAQQIATALYKLCAAQETILSENLLAIFNKEQIVECITQLKCCPAGLDSILQRTLCFGVAYHHAGLTMDERDIIEGGFRNGTIKILIATSTLSSGVNLPARRVIIRTPIFNGKPLNTLTYRQMIGRAGRMGRDTEGESILICQKNDFNVAKNLVGDDNLQAIDSCLGEGRLKRAILEIIASNVAATIDDLNLYSKCTLLNLKEENQDQDIINTTVDYLIKKEFIRLQDGTDKYIPTGLGKACLNASLPPEEGLALFAELDKARQCFVLDTELHLIYTVTPYSACNQLINIDWMTYLTIWEKLPLNMKRVADLVGVKIAFIIGNTRGRTSNDGVKLLIHKRFYIALALQELVNEVPLNNVANKFNCNRGMLQQLQQSAASFAGMVTAFTRQLKWRSVELLVGEFQDRLQFGIAHELLDLMRVSLLNGQRARVLYNAGIETLVDLASVDVYALEVVLRKARPFETEYVKDGESDFEAMKRNQMRCVWVTGKQGLTELEAAQLLIDAARSFLQLEMGLGEVNWQKQYESSQSSDKSSCSVNATNLEECKCKTPEEQVITSPKNEIFTTQKIIDTWSSFESSNIIETSPELNICRTPLSCKRKHSTTNLSALSDDLFAESTPCKKSKISLFKPSNFDHIEIIDVCTDKKLFLCLIKDIAEVNCIGISVGCDQIELKQRKIGDNLLDGDDITHNDDDGDFTYRDVKVTSICLCWDDVTAYYVNMQQTDAVTSNEKSSFLSNLLQRNDLIVRMFDAKEQIKMLKLCCDIGFTSKCEDPKIADWLLVPEGEDKCLKTMVRDFIPTAVKLVQTIGSFKTRGCIGLETDSTTPSKNRCCIDALVTWRLIEVLKERLFEEKYELMNTFETEMHCLKILADMELHGFGINVVDLQNLADLLKEHIDLIERKAYQMAGTRFSLTSTKDVAKVLGIYDGKRRVTTNKQVLQQNSNPVSDLIMLWRKLNSTLTKMVYPLLRLVDKERIHPNCILRNSTGRVSMHEPNMQNLPRDFSFPHPTSDFPTAISCRKVFQARDKHILISGDYCQLELRLLAHFSQDELLAKIMRSKVDIFKRIAAKWHRIGEMQVDDGMRQHVKQICYGIVYGIGQKALSEQLMVSEEEVVDIVETFHSTYPSIRRFIADVVRACEKCGYVETLAGRRRYLELINDSNSAIKSQAERQAVNTKIQGSAADIAKRAMVAIDDKITEKFKGSRNKPRLVLQLHDELIYEVSSKYSNMFTKLLRGCMEKAVILSVPLPVTIKSGHRWGELK